MFSVQCGQQLENEHMWLMPMSSERIRLWIRKQITSCLTLRRLSFCHYQGLFAK